jgi:hypothetical protein
MMVHYVGLGSLATFAAIAHEINAKSNSERRLCGQNGPLTSNIEGRLSGKSIAIDHVG